MVRICTAAASLSRRRVRSPVTSLRASVIRPRIHASSAVSPSRSRVACVVQRLRDVAQVGEQPLAALAGQHPGRHVAAARPRSRTPRPPRAGAAGRPRTAARRRRPRSAGRPAASSSAAVWPKNEVSAAARTRSLRCGCVERLQQADPLVGALGGEDAAAAGDHGLHPGRDQRAAGDLALLAGSRTARRRRRPRARARRTSRRPSAGRARRRRGPRRPGSAARRWARPWWP